MNQLVSRIEDVRSRLETLRRHRLKETPTRAIIIDPVLEALGWDIRDPDEVEHEFPTIDGRSVDYALKLNRKPVLLLEAKALDDPLDDVKAVAQIVRYAAAEGIVWCVLSNGVCWRVYRSIEECSAPDKLMFEVSFDPKHSTGVSVQQLAEHMWRFSREQMVRGTLDALGEQTFTDSKIRKALESLMRNPPRTLLNLVRRATGDERLNPRRVRESLTRICGGTVTLSGSVAVSPDEGDQVLRAHVLQRQVGSAARITSTPRHSLRSATAYSEAHHTAGKPQEVIELYRAMERECLALRAGLVEKRMWSKKVFEKRTHPGLSRCSITLIMAMRIIASLLDVSVS